MSFNCGYNLTAMPERLQKILAQAGYGSHCACEDSITAGRVRVNGKIAELGQKADPASQVQAFNIEFDWRTIFGTPAKFFFS
jgi:16S rRNA U516 pseudouridylate synthase RsuA-like enzyme